MPSECGSVKVVEVENGWILTDREGDQLVYGGFDAESLILEILGNIGIKVPDICPFTYGDRWKRAELQFKCCEDSTETMIDGVPASLPTEPMADLVPDQVHKDELRAFAGFGFVEQHLPDGVLAEVDSVRGEKVSIKE